MQEPTAMAEILLGVRLSEGALKFVWVGWVVVVVVVVVVMTVELCFAISSRDVLSSLPRFIFAQLHGSDGVLTSWIVCVGGSLGLPVDVSSVEGFEPRVSVAH